MKFLEAKLFLSWKLLVNHENHENFDYVDVDQVSSSLIKNKPILTDPAKQCLIDV